jgi:hypothetical protein
MVTVTPANIPYTRSFQDCDEKQALLSDLSKNRADYLSHPDGFVRSAADWTMEYYGIRTLRQPDRQDADSRATSQRWYLHTLYQRLRTLAGR